MKSFPWQLTGYSVYRVLGLQGTQPKQIFLFQSLFTHISIHGFYVCFEGWEGETAKQVRKADTFVKRRWRLKVKNQHCPVNLLSRLSASKQNFSVCTTGLKEIANMSTYRFQPSSYCFKYTSINLTVLWPSFKDMKCHTKMCRNPRHKPGVCYSLKLTAVKSFHSKVWSSRF